MSAIDGRTQLVGLIGWPVEHSLSPAMHNAAFAALDLNWRYLPLPVPPGQAETAVRGLAALGFRGANVTVPHKEAVLAALDAVDDAARAIGAVNTLRIERGEHGAATIAGYNTDGPGFIAALGKAGIDPAAEGRTVIVGAGGAARAAAAGLLQAGSGEIYVLSRRPEQGAALAGDLGRLPQHAGRLRALPLEERTLLAAARAATLLVNATPLGMWPQVEASIWPEETPVPKGLVVVDLVYNPRPTRLLRQAQRSGARTIDGLEMLLQQGALAFELWTGRPAPLKVMRAACERALGG